ncbi:hypothetical protein HNI00_10335 [Thermoleptolyngbya oregonensis NK1-22]|uniref:Uncharacterized protein n=1 Tax=Thermoleptolyngbya oregonensis NK1-22 TaxID=2547457 RepID=A0AA97B9Y9_9CYAN|nr:hypothetical protein [Thermoleptolyngbya oregonensis]WOB43510.1 hypothetical protein HNI00_10335 [Thermoleptolyngbya oregonensis NK1-22]
MISSSIGWKLTHLLALRITCFGLLLDLILDRLEIDTPFQLSERIKQIALDPKRKVEAIRLYQEETKVTLREAVDAIDAYIAQHQASSNR